MPPALARLLAALGASEPYSPSPSSQLRAIVERCPELSPTLPAIDAVDDADAAGLFVAAQPVLVASGELVIFSSHEPLTSRAWKVT